MPSIEFARLLLRLLLLSIGRPSWNASPHATCLDRPLCAPTGTASRASPCLSAAGYHHRRLVRCSNLVRFTLDGGGGWSSKKAGNQEVDVWLGRSFRDGTTTRSRRTPPEYMYACNPYSLSRRPVEALLQLHSFINRQCLHQYIVSIPPVRRQAFATTLLSTRPLSAGELALSSTSHGERTLHPHWGCIR